MASQLQSSSASVLIALFAAETTKTAIR